MPPGTGGTTPTSGSTSTTSSTSTSTTSTSTTVAPQGIIHPTGSDDIILRIAYENGFVAPGVAFADVPTLLVSGGRRVITPGVTTAIYPGPLLPALFERSITEQGVEKLLAFAEAAHLLQTPPDYSAEVNVADVPDTVVVLAANGARYVHSAPALGFEDTGESPARKTLQAFVKALENIETVVGAENLGENKPLVADAYRMQAFEFGDVPADISTPTTASVVAGPAPTYVAWPAGTGVKLAEASRCALVSASAIGSLFVDANQLTYFTEDSKAYQVTAIAKLPGDSC